jgi:predicted Zn-ribbon and HTH transcriptional regulator
MFKYFFVLTLAFNLSSNAFASATTKLADYLVSGSGVVELLGKYQINGDDAKMVESYLGSSLASFGSKKSLTKEELSVIISKLPVTGADATVRKELQLLLDKPEKEIKKADVVNAINNIIYLANRHGQKSVIVTCAECKNETLAKNGFKFTVESLKNSSSVKVLNQVLPNNPAELNSFISSRMKRLGLGDYSKVTPNLVAPEEEKTLALFLGLAENGSADQKELIAAIKRISTRNGKTNIIDPVNPHKFWKMFAEDMDSNYMKGMADTLNQVASRAEKDKVQAEEAFYRLLKDKAGNDSKLLQDLQELKAKRCFFK